MNLYITSGTPEFMESIQEKYSKEEIFLLHGKGNSLLVHETEKKTVFQVPRKFEVVESAGKFAHNGYFVLHNIPISDEGKPIFEYLYTNLTSTLEKEPGFIALRVLKPIKSDVYVILTEWTGPNSFDVWQKSADINFDKLADKQNFFTSAPYISTYTSIESDEH
ncbi:antibiotic biosynthesis monooxygenase family protein [Psychrobacillus sp.]|uniref:antibiotic biosynthesis monooxygenase family protein n=1 Tax=Psychrobacillus sp. TaxID=1871623 RepID=UPI0028BE1FD4|nr:antibiotic biosynthesis monooxygenase family protein [Psychrobacillus sp.]